MAMVAERFDVYRFNLDPTVGSEIQKTRPCLIVSPDEMNRHIRTVIAAPMTTAQKDHPARVNWVFGKRKGQMVLDQIGAIDKARLHKNLGSIDSKTQLEAVSVPQRRLAF